MEPRVLFTAQAPRPIGPYSQAVAIGDVIYTSGQIALDPGTGKLVDDDIATQTRQVLSNLEAVLQAGGSSLKHVFKTTVFLADMADFATMNAIYGEAFSPETPPSRSTVQAARLPAGARVEIEVVAYIP